MNQKERELFRSLCSFRSEESDSGLTEAATPEVLGQLFFNRMAGVAYGTLENRGLTGSVNREFRNSLRDANIQNTVKNRSFFRCIQNLEELLSGAGVPYAMLKGAYLCSLYPEGYRTSNDIDLLVLPEDVTAIGKVLSEDGFRQGSVKNGKFVPAARKEIIGSRMMRGETVPYIREVGLPFMKFLEVDINFSLDYRPDDSGLTAEMLAGSAVRDAGEYRVRTLAEDDFFIHLCAHLYKEATALPWVVMKRDMTLYKYCDIYLLLEGTPAAGINRIFGRAKKLGMEKICAFAILQTAELFRLHNGYAVMCAESVLNSDPDFIHTVVSPAEKKRYVYTERDISERFFAGDRRGLLRGVKE